MARAMSPPSAHGTLVHAGPGHVSSFDGKGGAARVAYYSFPKGADPSLDDGVALARAAEGGWTVVEWTRRRRAP